MANEIEYIQIQWDDIHHTRNQDWKIIALILADFYALFNSGLDNVVLHLAITISGLIISLIGISVTITHWKNFYYKIKVITDFESKLGLGGEFYKPRYPVQAHILTTYILIFCTLLGWLLWILLKNLIVTFSSTALLLLVGLWLSFYLAKYFRRSILV